MKFTLSMTKNLNVKFNAFGKYPWKFTVASFNFSVIGIDFLSAYKLTVDPFNFCLVDKINNRFIPLKPAFTNPPPIVLHLARTK